MKRKVFQSVNKNTDSNRGASGIDLQLLFRYKGRTYYNDIAICRLYSDKKPRLIVACHDSIVRVFPTYTKTITINNMEEDESKCLESFANNSFIYRVRCNDEHIVISDYEGKVRFLQVEPFLKVVKVIKVAERTDWVWNFIFLSRNSLLSCVYSGIIQGTVTYVPDYRKKEEEIKTEKIVQHTGGICALHQMESKRNIVWCGGKGGRSNTNDQNLKIFILDMEKKAIKKRVKTKEVNMICDIRSFIHKKSGEERVITTSEHVLIWGMDGNLIKKIEVASGFSLLKYSNTLFLQGGKDGTISCINLLTNEIQVFGNKGEGIIKDRASSRNGKHMNCIHTYKNLNSMEWLDENKNIVFTCADDNTSTCLQIGDQIKVFSDKYTLDPDRKERIAYIIEQIEEWSICGFKVIGRNSSIFTYRTLFE